MRRRTTNSPIVAVVVFVLGVAAFVWLGWQGAAVYVVGFFAGALGTVVNARRDPRIQVRP